MNRPPSIIGRVAVRPATPPPSPRRLRAALLAALAAAAVALAFGVGRSTAGDEREPAREAGGAASLPHELEGLTPLGLPGAALDRRAAAAPRPAAPALAAAPAAPARRAPPEVVARVAAEAGLALEQARPDFVARCAPRDGPSGAKLTFNVTFDASGREIARGISEDRRLRAPALASCLRRLPIGSLRVSPPGANVGVRVSMNLP
jgi:hypothetical protein